MDQNETCTNEIEKRNSLIRLYSYDLVPFIRRPLSLDYRIRVAGTGGADAVGVAARYPWRWPCALRLGRASSPEKCRKSVPTMGISAMFGGRPEFAAMQRGAA